MGDLNRAIASLYDASVTAGLDDFRSIAFDVLKNFTPFDSAVWASGRQLAESHGVIDSIHTMHLIGQPDYVPAKFVTEYRDDDLFIKQARLFPGVPARVEDAMSWEAYRSSRIYREFLRPHDIEYAMGTMHIDAVIDILDFIVLWRRADRNAFSDRERRITQTLSLHMVNAWKHCQLLELKRVPHAASTPREIVRRARALVDDTGTIFTADADFGPIIQHIFPGWRGSELPHEFAALIRTGAHHGAVAGIECAIARNAGFNVLTVTAPPKTMPLSPGEFEVARLVCQGLSNGQIAAQRGVSVATIRNQIASAYRKLDLHSKVDLARAIG